MRKVSYVTESHITLLNSNSVKTSSLLYITKLRKEKRKKGMKEGTKVRINCFLHYFTWYWKQITFGGSFLDVFSTMLKKKVWWNMKVISNSVWSMSHPHSPCDKGKSNYSPLLNYLQLSFDLVVNTVNSHLHKCY